ncbi:hypothetical protein BKA57DRAFT_468958 [Linnemannia elongata]|nr:hypothetical protein BKA57DRAFT_468958 [Linnemannia elongata]
MPTKRTNMLLVCTFTRTHSITTSSLSPSIFPPDAPSQAYVPPLIDRYYSPSLHSLSLLSFLFSFLFTPFYHCSFMHQQIVLPGECMCGSVRAVTGCSWDKRGMVVLIPNANRIDQSKEEGRGPVPLGVFWRVFHVLSAPRFT